MKNQFTGVVAAGFLFCIGSTTPTSAVRVQAENMVQWTLNDNTNSITVTGNEFDGYLLGGRDTVDVATNVNGVKALHLGGIRDYVAIPIPSVSSNAVKNLWQKYPGNPAIGQVGDTVAFGQLVRNPRGGWYWFGGHKWSEIARWESHDLVNWSNQTTALASGGQGAWDGQLHVATVFQKPAGTWVMLYRGYDGSKDRIGMATSSDGSAFTRANNGGVDDGLFPQFGANYDPVGVILVGSRYYVYVSGDPTHESQNVYYSDDDFKTFTAWRSNPIFKDSKSFCCSVWQMKGSYYMLDPYSIGKLGVSTNAVTGDYGIALWRSTTPFFAPSDRIFLGYAVLNDRPYDQAYLDTPSVPAMDVYRTNYPPEFGDSLFAVYAGAPTKGGVIENLAGTSVAALSNLPPVDDDTRFALGDRHAFSFWVQFDTLSAGDAVFSIGNAPDDGVPNYYARILTTNNVLSLYQGDKYFAATSALVTNVPYHIVISDDLSNVCVYVNGAMASTYPSRAAASAHTSHLYIGTGFGGTGAQRFLHGYIWDFRIYRRALSRVEVVSLYNTGSASGPLLRGEIDRPSIGWSSVSGCLYRVYSCNDLVSGGWSQVWDTVGSGSEMCYTGTSSAGSTKFFRLDVRSE